MTNLNPLFEFKNAESREQGKIAARYISRFRKEKNLHNHDYIDYSGDKRNRLAAIVGSPISNGRRAVGKVDDSTEDSRISAYRKGERIAMKRLGLNPKEYDMKFKVS